MAQTLRPRLLLDEPAEGMGEHETYNSAGLGKIAGATATGHAPSALPDRCARIVREK
jgi:hypothetical protein